MRLGIDIGGTKAMLALVDENGTILARQKLSTGFSRSCQAVVEEIAMAAKAMVCEEKVSFVGIGVPGTVDALGQVVINAPNLNWKQEPVADFFTKASGFPCRVAQDTRAAAWGESRHPAMRDKKALVCITLGTGIGCGIVLDHRIWNGALGTAGEIGHIPVVPGGRPCSCGRRGCMEAYASGTGMAKIARERGVCDSTEELFHLAEAGHVQAIQIIQEATDYAAMAISALINLLSPDAVLFSGGLSTQKELFVDPILRRVRSWAYENGVGEALYLGSALLGKDAPVIGAAFLDEAK